MFWWLRKLFWWPRWTYLVVIGTSHASAEEAKADAFLKAQAAGGEMIAIAADAMCCGGEEGGAGAEWDFFILLRK